MPGVITSAGRLAAVPSSSRRSASPDGGSRRASAIDVTHRGPLDPRRGRGPGGSRRDGDSRLPATWRHSISDEDILFALGCRLRQVWGEPPVCTTLPSTRSAAVSLPWSGAALTRRAIFPIGGAAMRSLHARVQHRRFGARSGLSYALTVLVLAVGALAAFVATVHSERMCRAPRALPDRGGITGAGLPPSMATGIGFALERGRGRGAVPVRSSILGASFGVSAVVAALLFAASLDRLTSTPLFYGWTWDSRGGRERSRRRCVRTDAVVRSRPDGFVGDVALFRRRRDRRPPGARIQLPGAPWYRRTGRDRRPRTAAPARSPWALRPSRPRARSSGTSCG